MNEPEYQLGAALIKVQQALKVPKGQRNTFGNYNYRNAEDILEAVKPLLAEQKAAVLLSDGIKKIGERFYVEATATFFSPMAPGERIDVTALAREEETKKGMDGSQITGASSSYARKYALNGLFLIDDNRDSDATNEHDKAPQPAQKPVQTSNLSTGPFIRPTLMNQLRTSLKASQITGDAATVFVKNTIGKPTPTNEAEVQQIIAALQDLEQADAGHDPLGTD